MNTPLTVEQLRRSVDWVLDNTPLVVAVNDDRSSLIHLYARADLFEVLKNGESVCISHQLEEVVKAFNNK